MNVPLEFIQSIQLQLDETELQELLAQFTTESPTSIRQNPFKSTSSEQSELIPWCSTGYYLSQRPTFTLDPAFHAGAYYPQEASSMFLEQAIFQADLNGPIRALDLCAAPGGKSTHLLSLLSPESLLISNEVIRSRAGILAENLTKWGCANSVVTSSDPKAFAAFEGYFDLIVVDAPCSGEGLFRKEPGAMQEWSPGNVELCSQRQRRVLADVFPALKQNGILIYSTCTYNRLENEDNLNWVHANHAVEFLKIPLKPEWGVQEVDENDLIGYRFFPHRVKGEGFFLSVMRKLEPSGARQFKSKDRPKSVKHIDTIQHWIAEPRAFHFFDRPEGVRIIPVNWQHDLELLSQHLYIIQAGTVLGAFKHDKFIPDHAFALSNHLSREKISTTAINKEEALQYLRKENPLLSNAPKGYSLLTFNDLGLGWINGLGTRINNMYPTNWRIRMSNPNR